MDNNINDKNENISDIFNNFEQDKSSNQLKEGCFVPTEKWLSQIGKKRNIT